MSFALPLLFLACQLGSDSATDTAQLPDLSERLGPGEARAGAVTDESALFGGIAAEGRVGDFKIYNDRVQFIVQGVREGSYTAWQGGAVIDADIVRPEGQPGRDMADDWAIMAGTGHMPTPEVVLVVDDGVESGRAVLQMRGPESPLDYIVGVFENEDMVPDQGLYFVTDFILEADSHLLMVNTRVTATDGDVTTQLGDVIMGAKEISTRWAPGEGLTGEIPTQNQFVALVGDRNEQVIAVLAQPGESSSSLQALDFLGSLLMTVSAMGEGETLEEGESLTLRRYYGVGPDLATLTGDWLALSGESSQLAEGRVTAPDGPVAGARVTLLLDGEPWTMALTDSDGVYSAQVPASGELSAVVDGRGPGLHSDLPAGAAHYGPYGAEHTRLAALGSIEEGAEPIPLAEARGWSAGEGDLELGEPGWLIISCADGLPFEVRLTYTEGYDSGDGAFVQGNPSGYAALAWARDGEVRLPMEPGSYGLLAWRGVRWEVFSDQVTVEAGQESAVEVVLEQAYALDDWLVADPHSHASPSPDGAITMADRLTVAAATGIQLHFGTDHDHIVDYGPLLEPLGLQESLRSIVSCEMSPVIRGHLNLYPLQADPDAVNGGAWLWWSNLVDSTQQEFDEINAHLGDPLIQANHPMAGLASLAGWDPGRIDNGDFWSPDFHAVEVVNGGGHGEEVDFYLDLVSRGLLVAPVSVSDNHSYLGGSQGLAVTFLGSPTADPASFTDEDLREAFALRRSVASVGPFVQLSIPPGSLVETPAKLTVRVRAPSWIPADSITLLENGLPVERVAGTTARFTLDPEADAAYFVLVEGSQSMAPVSGSTPWALTSAILADVGGDGWQAALEPLAVHD